MDSRLKEGRHKENALSRLEESFIWAEKAIKEEQYGFIKAGKTISDDGSGNQSGPTE